MNEEQHHLVTGEFWHTVDRWWTANPTRRLYIELEAPDGEKIVVGYDLEAKTWKLQKA